MLVNSQIYMNSLRNCIKRFPYWEKLNQQTVLITGSTGLVCSYLVDMIMVYNEINNANIRLIITGRNRQKAIERFSKWFSYNQFMFVEQDMREPIHFSEKSDYIVHAAGNAYPKLYDKEPVETMQTNILGTDNLLKYALYSGTKNLLYISSGEVYGERNVTYGVEEDFCGHIDYMKTRSCYPVSKIAAETLCASYSKQFGIYTNVARLCHVYGPTMTQSDNRVINQFINNVLSNQNIVMKSSGSKIRSYCYVADAVLGILYILVCGENSTAYNVSYESSVISIKGIAELLAHMANKKVIFSQGESLGGTTIEQSILSNKKLKTLGWSGNYDMRLGLEETYNILKEIQGKCVDETD